MTQTTLTNAQNDLQAGQTIHGFHIDQVSPLPECRVVAIRATHSKSGAQLLHLYAPTDSENAFAVTFPTLPPDDTGLPHILEHAVLGGSKKFQGRDPFFEMIKMSMATFINAMTSQAYTVYPVASNVKKDFFNLVEVYVDAVFQPILSENTFRREGHHLTLEDNADLSSALETSGIVYNEMKGAYSTPESLMHAITGRGLFPDTALGLDSGGEPERIPELTYERFLQFHRDLYHPSNGQIFIYGDIPSAEHFQFLTPTLDAFDARPAHISTPVQPRWTTPRDIEQRYPIGVNEDTSARTFFTLNWVVDNALNPARVIDWEILSRLLLGTDAAPLKKALIDSKLAADTTFSGTWASAYEQTFHVGLKGSEPERVQAFEDLVLQTLTRLADEPFAQERIAAAFQQLSYETLEVQSLFPLHLLEAVNSAWPYGADPMTFLNPREQLEDARNRFAADPLLFNTLIRDGLLNNPHRLRVLLRPDCGIQAHNDAALIEKMAQKRALLDEKAIADIARSAAALEAAQDIPDSPEVLAQLPQLKASDLPAKPRRIPTQLDQVAGITVLRNDVFANGVNYLSLDIDLAGLPLDLYDALPYFSEVTRKCGAVGQDFAQIAQRREACTGGLWSSTAILSHATDTTQPLRRQQFGLKTLDAEAGKAFALLGDIVFGTDPNDRARLHDMMIQTRARYRTALVNDGMSTARRQAERGLNLVAAINHQFFSPDALRAVESLTENFEARADKLIHQIEAIRDFLHNRRRWTMSFTGSDTVFDQLLKTLTAWSARMDDSPIVDVLPAFNAYATPPREGLAGPMQVAHCAEVMPAPHLAHPDVSLFKLGLRLANFDYMLPAIRLKGNAYGGGASYDSLLGTLALYSFRDPNIVETLDTFKGLRDFIASQNWSQLDIDRAIIGCAKDAENPIRPGDATERALLRHLRGDTNAHREQRHSALLAGTPASVKETTLRVLDVNGPHAAVCVVSSREKLDAANERLGDKSLTITDILP